MKLNREEREKMAAVIRRRWQKSDLSNAQLAAAARVDPGQTSRILDGQFRTVGGNVLRICNVLGVDSQGDAPPEPTKEQARKRAAWAKLEASVRRAWDETPRGADRLVAVIDAVAQIASRNARKRTDPDTFPAAATEG